MAAGSRPVPRPSYRALAGRDPEQAPELCTCVEVTGDLDGAVGRASPEPQVDVHRVAGHDGVRGLGVDRGNATGTVADRAQDREPGPTSGLDADRAGRGRRDAALDQPMTEPQVQDLVDAVGGEVRVDGADVQAGGS